MHRSLLCLPFLFAALSACDDAPTTPEAAPVMAPGVCGMTLPGVGNVEANVLLTEERRPGPI